MNGVVLAVLDGIGIRDEEERNAVAQAATPHLDRLFATYPYTELAAYGEAVGLPEGYIGNSEVGHLHLGAGRIIPQELVRINQAVEDGTLFENDTLQEAAEHAERNDATVHVMGIASDGGVHGHIDHLLALARFFARNGREVKMHAFLDGRDVRPESAEEYLDRIEEQAAELGTGHVASFMGRYYAMDRDHNWERTETAYRALVGGEARSSAGASRSTDAKRSVRGEGRTAASVADGMEMAREEDRNDYFVAPTLIDDVFEPIAADDVVVFANYRKDRARQLTRAFIEPGFEQFETAGESVHFVSMMPYEDGFDNPTVFTERQVDDTLGAVLSRSDLKQLRLSESQKEPHVTYFFNGQREAAFPATDVQIFPSADLPSYDEQPEMEAVEITDYAVAAMEDGDHAFVLINYPNCDLVGHTGDLAAAIEAVETVDAAAGRLADAALEHNYALILTSDHGNAEEMTGAYETSHTLNPVPFCIVADDADMELTGGGIADIAPTVIDLLDLEPPEEMTDTLVKYAH